MKFLSAINTIFLVVFFVLTALFHDLNGQVILESSSVGSTVNSYVDDEENTNVQVQPAIISSLQEKLGYLKPVAKMGLVLFVGAGAVFVFKMFVRFILFLMSSFSTPKLGAFGKNSLSSLQLTPDQMTMAAVLLEDAIRHYRRLNH